MNNRITIKKFLDYCEKVDLQTLANLPPPNDFFRKHSISDVQKVAEHLVAVWKHIILSEDDVWDDLEVEVSLTGTKVNYNAEEAVEWVLFVIAFHYHHAAMALFDRIGVDSKVSPPPMDINFLAEVAEKVLENEDSISGSFRRFTFNYFSCLWGSFLLCLMHQDGVRSSMVDALEVFTHYAAYRLLNELRDRDAKGIEWNLKWLLAYESFEALALAYDISTSRIKKTEAKTGYLDLNIHELSSLARRDEFVIKRYGEKAVEREFEFQLSILMQSFGFYVVPASLGEKSVDLICIPSSTSDAGVLMVDAKSSKHPYNLPTSDARALEEYHRHISQTVTTLPKVTDILIVGGDPSRSLPNRLRDLESRLRVNVRFCGAEHLGILRTKIPGSLQPYEFFQVIRESSYVIQPENLENLAHREQSRNESLNKLVKTFMGLRIQIKQTKKKED